MKIAVFAWECQQGLVVSSVATHISELARTLAERGHEIHLFTRPAPGRPERESAGAVRIHRVPFESRPNFIDEVQSFCRAFAEAAKTAAADEGGFDLLHAHDWVTANAGVWAREALGVPLLFTLHSIEPSRCGTKELKGDARRVADHEDNGCRQAARVITVSHALRRETMAFYQVPEWRCEVVYNGVDLRRYEGVVDPGAVKARHGIGPLDPTILYAGTLEYRMGPDLLADALPAILAARPEARVLFAGDGPMRRELEERVKRLGAAHAVRFTPLPAGNDTVDLFRACDLVCVPSRNDPFSLVVLEAWAAGKPVVVTQDGGSGEYVWHDVNGVHAHATPESIAWAVNHLFRDFDRARWTGANGRAAAETAFTWSRAAAHTAEIYERTLQEAAKQGVAPPSGAKAIPGPG